MFFWSWASWGIRHSSACGNPGTAVCVSVCFKGVIPLECSLKANEGPIVQTKTEALWLTNRCLMTVSRHMSQIKPIQSRSRPNLVFNGRKGVLRSAFMDRGAFGGHIYMSKHSSLDKLQKNKER